MRAPATISFFLISALTIPMGQLCGQSRAQEIAASFTKHKDAVKEKNGIRVEKYKDVRSEPTVMQNPTDYVGVYEVADLGYVLHVESADNGGIRVYGSEAAQGIRTFELANAKIASAVLTGTKVYRDGTRERFEGAFLTRIDRDSPNEAGKVTRGLGVLLAAPLERNGISHDKLFYQLKQ
ncbi:MAG TPA: hypothetical protein VG454_16735 [Gemmatimonadales bacterium]|nr:hypothetical protein [Gemmatimonadales bacterium]